MEDDDFIFKINFIVVFFVHTSTSSENFLKNIFHDIVWNYCTRFKRTLLELLEIIKDY